MNFDLNSSMHLKRKEKDFIFNQTSMKLEVR